MFVLNDNLAKSRKVYASQILKNNGLVLALIGLVIVMAFTAPVFFNSQNIVSLFTRSVGGGMMALGMAIVLLSGGLDMSVAAVANLSGLICTGLFQHAGLSPAICVIGGLAVGIVVGFVNGLMVAYLRINSLIVTIATMTIVQGICWVYSEGKNISPAPDGFTNMTEIKVFGMIPISVFIWAAVGVCVFVFLKYFKLGRTFFVIGGNASAAMLSGIRVKQVTLAAFVICGAMASLAGLMLTARLNSAIPGGASGMELTVIAACVIGGTSLSGGIIKVSGTFLGILLISLIGNAITLWGVPTAYDNVISGIIIAIAAVMDSIRTRGSVRSL
jgi:ribose transport system permease protein